MCGCASPIQTVSYNYQPSINNNNVNCEVEESTILQYKELFLNLYNNQDYSTYTSFEVNVYLGQIDTMLNLNDYCRFDLSHIEL